MTKFIINLSIVLVSQFNGATQTSLISTMKESEIQQEPGSNYVDTTGKTVGCDWNLECDQFSIVFYSVQVDKVKRQISLKGRTYLPHYSYSDSLTKSKFGDTVGLFSVSIFTAVPSGKTIIIPETIFRSADYQNEPYRQFPFREGDFDITLNIYDRTRLYFVGYNHVLKEYDINKLFID